MYSDYLYVSYDQLYAIDGHDEHTEYICTNMTNLMKRFSYIFAIS